MAPLVEAVLEQMFRSVRGDSVQVCGPFIARDRRDRLQVLDRLPCGRCACPSSSPWNMAIPSVPVLRCRRNAGISLSNRCRPGPGHRPSCQSAASTRPGCRAGTAGCFRRCLRSPIPRYPNPPLSCCDHFKRNSAADSYPIVSAVGPELGQEDDVPDRALVLSNRCRNPPHCPRSHPGPAWPGSSESVQFSWPHEGRFEPPVPIRRILRALSRRQASPRDQARTISQSTIS